jgi:hypothetical protein
LLYEHIHGEDYEKHDVVVIDFNLDDHVYDVNKPIVS